METSKKRESSPAVPQSNKKSKGRGVKASPTTASTSSTSSRIDAKAKLERSRQSARECRARKKLRYQYLEELVAKREEAIFVLKTELESIQDVCKKIDSGILPLDAVNLILDEPKDSSGRTSTVTK